jgi:hypothetical protein
MFIFLKEFEQTTLMNFQIHFILDQDVKEMNALNLINYSWLDLLIIWPFDLIRDEFEKA